jgi:hypothetical protein
VTGPASAYRSAVAVLALAASLALPAVGAAANVLTVKHDTVLHLNGTDVVCSVLQNGTGSTVACFHLPGGPSTTVRKGFAIAANEGVVAVEPPGSTTPVKVAREPSFDAQPMFTGGAAHSELVNLALDDEAKVSGTNMAVIVSPAKGGGNAIGVIYLDRNGLPIIGSYVVGISNHYVTIVKVTGSQKATTIYRHAVY